MDRKSLIAAARQKMSMEKPAPDRQIALDQPVDNGSNREMLLAKAKQKMAANPPEEEGLLGRAVEGAEDLGKGFLENVVMPVVQPIGEFVDTYTGAPMRAAVGAAQNKQNPISAFSNQFGEDPKMAPTGKELAKRMGLGETSVSDVVPNLYSESGKEWTKFKRGGLLDPTASGAAGLGLDLALDPTNVIPMGAIAEGVGKAAKATVPYLGKAVKGLAKGTAIAGDVATGANLGKAAIKGAGEVSDVVSNIGKMKFVPEYEKNLMTAIKAGLTPDELSEAARYGKGSVPSRLERHIAEGPMGQKVLDKFKNTSNKIENALDEALYKHSSGKVLDPLSAGDALKTSYANAEKSLLESADLTYKKAAQLSPNLQLTEKAAQNLASTINGVKKRAAGYMTRGATDAQVAIGKDLDNLATRLGANGTNYKQLADQIGFIGEAMTDPNLNRFHAKELRNVYNSLKDSLIDTVSDLHKDLGDQLVGNNARMTEFFKSRDALGKAIQSTKSNPESLFKTLAGDGNKIAELKKIMPTEDFNAFRGSYLNSLIKRNTEGVLWESSLQSLNKNRGRLRKMFNESELNEIEDFLKLGNAQGVHVLSTSGTGGSNIFKDMKHGIQSGIVNKQILKGIKTRAGLIPDLEKTQEIARPAGISEMTLGVEKPKGLLNLPRRGPKEMRLKGAQSIAPSQYRNNENE